MAILRKWRGKDLNCFSQSGVLQFQMCFKVIYKSKWAVSSKNMMLDRIDTLQCVKVKKQSIDKMTCTDDFSSYLVIFPVTLSPF